MNSTETRSTFRFQQRFLFLELPLICVIIAILILSWLPYMVSFISFDSIVRSAMRATLYLNITVFSLYFFFRLIKRELRKTEFIITNERLIKKTTYNISVVPLAEIISIRFVPIPLLRGYLQIKTSKSRILVPLFIENLTGFAKKLQINSVNCGKKDVFGNSFKLFHKMSAIYDLAYRRSVSIFYPLIGISLFSIIVNLIIAGKLWSMPLIPLLLWTMCGLAFPLLALLLSNWRINEHLLKNLTSDTESIAHLYRSEYLLGGLLIFFLYLFFGIFFRTIFAG